MAGAYRCAVCGIDFPTGVQGASDRGDSGADAAADPRPRAPVEPEPQPAAETEQAPETAADAPAERKGPPPPPTPEPKRAPGRGESSRSASLDVRPRSAARSRARAERRSTAVATVPTSRRRTAAGKARGLALTVFFALVLLGAVAVGAVYFGQRLAGKSTGLSSVSTTSVTAGDGWVSVPKGGRAAISATGPYRIRLDGEVYSLTRSRLVNVPAGTAASVKVVRAGDTATIRQAAR